MDAPRDLELFHNKTARQDPLIWVMLVFGLFFACVSFQVDPQLNCDDDGNCNSWLVHVARGAGFLMALASISLLLHNRPRGSCVDPETGELLWWYWNVRTDQPMRHPLNDISRIQLDLQGEDYDIHLFDGAGERIGFAGTEVIPWPYKDWVEQLITHYPHIKFETKE